MSSPPSEPSDPRPHLRGLLPEELSSSWSDFPLSPVLARRVVNRVLAQGRDDLDGVSGLSKVAAREIRQRTRLDRLELVDRRSSTVDPFVKYLFRTGDGRVFEAVRIPLEKPRFSVCVSSQVGCALECAFCETGRLGFLRNLEPWEIVDQVLSVRRDSPERPVTGVVFQGQGEPFQNYENVIKAAALLRHPCGPRIGSDRITISTVGLLPQIERYTEQGHPYRLILSLTSAFQDKRSELVPIGKRYRVAELLEAMKRLALRQRNLVNIAWVLMGGVNDQPEEARELASLLAGAPARISVIDVNDPTGEFRRATDAERSRFLSALAAERLGFVRRYSGGPDIHAACGMLASTAHGGAWGVAARSPSASPSSSPSSSPSLSSASPSASAGGDEPLPSPEAAP